MKITPINFSTYLEPELISFWKEHRFSEGKKVEVQRTHSLKHRQTTLNAVATDKNGTSSLLSSVQLIEIPQQENNPALNGMIHLSHMNQPTQLLMVFKSDSDADRWAKAIVNKIRMLMVGAPDEAEGAPVEETEEESEEPSEPIADDETETA